MKRKVLSFILALALLCSVFSRMSLLVNAAVTSGQCGDNLYWSFDESTGKLTITGNGDMWDFYRNPSPFRDFREKIKSIALPKGLKTIGSWSFFGSNNLTNITIPDGVIKINEHSFSSCSSLTSVIFPNSMNKIGSFAFANCSNLKSIAFPDNLTEIWDGAFQYCSLNSISIPNGVKTIGSGAFGGCKMTSVTIPSSVTQINDGQQGNPFDACKELSEIIVSPSNPSYCSVNGVLYDKEKTTLIFCPRGKTGKYQIPDGVTSISYSAFACCFSLTSVIIPESVTTIGGEAFSSCRSLISIAIPPNVSYVDMFMFQGCSSMTSITIPVSVIKINQYALSGCDNLRDVYYSGSKTQWQNLSIEQYNDSLYNATIHYNSSESDIPISFCGYNARFKTDYFSEPASTPNKELALLSGILSWAVYCDKERPSIRDVFSTIGIPSQDYYDNSNEREKDLRFAIAKKTVFIDGIKTNLLLIIARGTVAVNEAMGDHYTNAKSPFQGYFAYDLIYQFQEAIMDQLVIFCDSHKELEHEPLKVLVTGHSLGGAAANLIAARFTRYSNAGSWWADLTTKDDIYCYTFGAIDSINTDGTVSEGFENIHNITNYSDSFGPNGWPAFVSAAGRSRYGKFGHIDLFFDNRDKGELGKYENHQIWTYLDAVVAKDTDPNRIFYDKSFLQKIISVHCPVDISIFRDGELVGQIINNKVIDNVTKIPISVVEESKYILIQDDRTYRIEINATENGVMEFECKDAATGNEAKSFPKVSLERNKQMRSEVGGTIKTQDIRLFVVDTKGNPISEITENGTEAPVTNPFFDVNQGIYYYDAVLWAVNHNPQITNGTDSTHFSPDKTCTRAQVVTFLWRTAGSPEPISTSNPFADVKSDSYYYKAVLWAVEKGITTGTSASKFSPNSGCTRGQVVTFLWRFFDQSEPKSVKNPFTDVKEDQYYCKAVLWAVEKEVTKGTSENKFSPGSICTRAQIVTFLYRAMRY